MLLGFASFPGAAASIAWLEAPSMICEDENHMLLVMPMVCMMGGLSAICFGPLQFS